MHRAEHIQHTWSKDVESNLFVGNRQEIFGCVH